MTDQELAIAWSQATEIERHARTHWRSTHVEDLPERDAALVTMRQAAALVRMVEQWMTARALRAALT
jgi:hypothetical protein